jgi:hypothetical protein
MAAELAIDEIGEREADQGLQDDGPDDKMSGRLHGRPNVRVGQDGMIIVGAEIADGGVGAVGAVVCEREVDRPHQGKDVDRQQQHHGRGDEHPRDGLVGEAADAPAEALGRGEGSPLHKREIVAHGAPPETDRLRPSLGGLLRALARRRRQGRLDHAAVRTCRLP